MGLWTEILLFNAMGATVLAAAVALAGRWIRRPTVRHALWLIVLLKLVGIPALEIALIPTRDHVWAFVAGGTEQPTSLPLMSAAVDPRPSATPGVRAGERMDRTDGWTRGEIGTPVATASAIDHRASNPPTPAARSVDWRWLFPLVAGLGTIALLGLATIRVFRFHRRLRVATEAPAGLQARANHLAIGVGLSGAPRIRVVPGRMSPSLWPGIGSCQILLPAALLADLSDAERDCLILHELAHVRRRDHWIRPLELLVTALYWWLPVAWWAR